MLHCSCDSSQGIPLTNILFLFILGITPAVNWRCQTFEKTKKLLHLSQIGFLDSHGTADHALLSVWPILPQVNYHREILSIRPWWTTQFPLKATLGKFNSLAYQSIDACCLIRWLHIMDLSWYANQLACGINLPRRRREDVDGQSIRVIKVLLKSNTSKVRRIWFFVYIRKCEQNFR